MPLRQREGIGAVEHIAAPGGIDGLDFEGGLVLRRRPAPGQIPAAFVPAGHDGDLPVRAGQFADGLCRGPGAGELRGKPLGKNQMIGQRQELRGIAGAESPSRSATTGMPARRASRAARTMPGTPK